MRTPLFLLTAALTFAALPLSTKLGPVPGALLAVALAVALASAASARPASLAIAAGALGALASGLFVYISPALAGAALFALIFAERHARVRERGARLAHLGLAITSGAVATSLALGFSTASLALRAVAVIVAAVLVALPLLIDADDPAAHALDAASSLVSEPARASLRAGAELRRTIDEAMLDRKTARQIDETWASLLRLAEVRLRLERTRAAQPPSAEAKPTSEPSPSAPAAPARAPADAVRERVDARIAEHVAVLTRAYTAADAAKAAEVSLDDAALRGVETAGESLEQVSRAIVDEV